MVPTKATEAVVATNPVYNQILRLYALVSTKVTVPMVSTSEGFQHHL